MKKDNCLINVAPNNEDIKEILDWLKVEKEREGEGFYNNKGIIEDAFSKGNAIVLKIEDKNIGLTIWSRDDVHANIDIFVIKPSYRSKGYGEFFYKAVTNYFLESDLFAVKLFCSPTSSEKFWSKMGLCELPDGIPGQHELTYFDILVETASTSYNSKCDKIELWDVDYHSSNNIEPKWTWYVDVVNGELVNPIVYPCNCNWKIRWTKQGKVIKEAKVKYFSDDNMEFYYSPFLVLDVLEC